MVEENVQFKTIAIEPMYRSPRLKELISTNMKLIRRSFGTVWLFLLISFLTSILAAMKPRGVSSSGMIAIVVVADMAFSAILFEHQFGSGERERILYQICSIDPKEIFFAKNLATLFTIYPFFLFNTCLVAGIARAPVSSVLDGLLYLSTGSFVLLHLGNLISSHRNEESLVRTPILLAIVNIAFIVAASLPYSVFVIALEDRSICDLFLLVSVLSWYFVSIPSSRKTVMSNKFLLAGQR